MKPYEDPQHHGNAVEHRTGARCIEKGCEEPAGTLWSPHWCQKHNAERINRINASLDAIVTRP